MFSKVIPFFMHAVSSVHVGSGSEVGLVDLPVQREKHTKYPKIESSSLKGALRSAIKEKLVNKGKLETEKFKSVFGSEPASQPDADSTASAISFSDARTFLFPVRSIRGTFAWVTCPLVIDRFNEEMRTYFWGSEQAALDLPPKQTANAVASKDKLLINDNKLVLEEYTFEVKQTEEARQLARWLETYLGDVCRLDLGERLVVLDDNNFNSFVQLSTEVNARIHINDSGTAEGGALWYEENVPPETVFYSTMFLGRPRVSKANMTAVDDVATFINEHFPAVFQIGGDSTLGRGLIQTVLLKAGAENGAK